MATATKPKGNVIVERRVADKTPSQRRKAVKRFTNGDSIIAIAKDLGTSPTKAKYLVMQQMVEDGAVSRIDPSDVEAIKAAVADENDPQNNWHWLACRTGLSTGRVRGLAES